MGRNLIALLLAVAAGPAWAQQSATYRLEEHVLNAGGHPSSGVSPASPSFFIARGSIGDPLLSGVMGSGSFVVSGGFLAPYPSPGEVMGFDVPSSNLLTWDPEGSAGVYNVYRAQVSTLPLGSYGGCHRLGLTTTSTTAGGDPSPGVSFFYLVTVENLLGEEGTKGFQSGGAQRAGNACP